MTKSFLIQSERVRFFFKAWSRIYDSALFQAPIFSRVHRQMLGAISGQSPASVLDVGCGTGELLLEFERLWPQAKLVGIDLTKDMLDKAREKIDATLIEGNVYDLPFDDKEFDLITNSISSHYYMDLDRALSEMARVCKPGGSLVIASMGNGPLRFIPGPWKRQIGMWNSAFRSPLAQGEALQAAGFEVSRIEKISAYAWLYVCERNKANDASNLRGEES